MRHYGKTQKLFFSLLLLVGLASNWSLPQVNGQTPTLDPGITPTPSVTPTATLTLTPTLTPTITPSPTPTPYTNPAGKQPKGRQAVLQQVQKRSAAITTKAQDILARIDSVWARVQSKITTFGAKGKDITPLQGAAAMVQIKRQAAADAIASASAGIAQIGAAKNPGKTTRQVIVQFQAIKTALKAYHQAVIEVIKNIKGMSNNTGVFPTVPPTAVPASPTASVSATLAPTSTTQPTPTAVIPGT